MREAGRPRHSRNATVTSLAEGAERRTEEVAAPRCQHRPSKPPNTQEASSNDAGGTWWPASRKALPPWPIHRQTLGGSHRDAKLAQVRGSHPNWPPSQTLPDLIRMDAWARNGHLNSTVKQNQGSSRSSPRGFQEPLSKLMDRLSEASPTGRAARQGLPTAKRQETSLQSQSQRDSKGQGKHTRPRTQ